MTSKKQYLKYGIVSLGTVLFLSYGLLFVALKIAEFYFSVASPEADIVAVSVSLGWLSGAVLVPILNRLERTRLNKWFIWAESYLETLEYPLHEGENS